MSEHTPANHAESAAPSTANGYVPLGPALHEDEHDHLRRVAAELGGANRPVVERLTAILSGTDEPARVRAAAELGRLGDRESIAVLRRLLEGEAPAQWELAIHGLRQSREREGWLCLESVAQDSIPLLAEADPAVHRPAALRLLTMGRTKTMDRLFRAIDGHSRSIPEIAARRFVEIAIASLPTAPAQVMALRLGVEGGSSHTPAEVAVLTGTDEERVRALEAEAWRLVQTPRPYEEISAALT